MGIVNDMFKEIKELEERLDEAMKCNELLSKKNSEQFEAIKHLKQTIGELGKVTTPNQALKDKLLHGTVKLPCTIEIDTVKVRTLLDESFV